MFRKLFFLAGLVSLAAAACSGVISSGEGSGANITEIEAAPIKGALAPDFSLVTVDGKQVSLSQFRGKTVLVNFWATWCAPCRLEMPAIQSEFEQHSPDLVILAVNFSESAEAVRDFQNELGFTFDPLLDTDGSIQELYQVRGYPSTYLVDPDGIIQVVHIGLMTEGQLEGYLNSVGLSQLTEK